MESAKNETVVSFLQEEMMDTLLEPEALDQWNKIVGELGLKGQGETVSPGGNKSPIPYLFMVPTVRATFNTLCPREVALEDYSAAPIPLKALSLIKLAKDEGHFDRIMIRYDDKSPEPVAIGQKGAYYGYPAPEKTWSKLTPEQVAAEKEAGKDPYFSPGDEYLIARWGAEDKPLDQLAVMAKERHMRQEAATAKAEIKELEHKLNRLAEDATLMFGV